MTARRSRPGIAATVFYTVLGNLGLVVATIVFGLLATFLGFLLRERGVYVICRWWSRVLLWTSGVRLEASSETPLEPEKGYVFMANHQSLFDIPVLLTTLPGETRMLAKRGLFQVPVFGWGLRAAGFIPVDRGRREAARQSFAAALSCLQSGVSVLLFPEETRSRDGELLPFKPGGFLIALKTGHPLVPVGIEGTLEIRPRGSLVNRPGRVRVRYGRPIDTAERGVRDKPGLMEEVRADISRLRDGTEYEADDEAE